MPLDIDGIAWGECWPCCSSTTRVALCTGASVDDVGVASGGSAVVAGFRGSSGTDDGTVLVAGGPVDVDEPGAARETPGASVVAIVGAEAATDATAVRALSIVAVFEDVSEDAAEGPPTFGESNGVSEAEGGGWSVADPMSVDGVCVTLSETGGVV